VAEQWNLQGELTLSCSCTVFCPCVLSLGEHPPTEDRCQTWAAVRIDQGRYDEIDLSGLNAAVMIEIPGLMSRGNWTAALFVDENASIRATEGLTRIFTGKAGGSTHLLSILVSGFLGVQQAPIRYRTEGQTRLITIDKIVEGAITPVPGKAKDQNVTIRNSGYWIAPDVTIAKADKSRFRAFGRNWNFTGRSAEICQIDWGNR
jgi:hypothetical protein